MNGLQVYAVVPLPISPGMNSPGMNSPGTNSPAMAAHSIAAGVLLSRLMGWYLSRVVLRSTVTIAQAGWWPRRPIFEPFNSQAVQLCTTDDLGRLQTSFYHGDNDRTELFRLRTGWVAERSCALWSRAGLVETVGDRVPLLFTSTGTAAAMVAAVEGWQ